MPIVCGNARFTVIDSVCIRLEYSPQGSFVDEPSFFAQCREPGFTDFSQSQEQGNLEIMTTRFVLHYRDDGNPFHSGNLNARIRMPGEREATWHYGKKAEQNLGGTLATLDGLSGPVDLGQGLLSREGWAFIDDSANYLLKTGWPQPRPCENAIDAYFFGYGLDYQRALQSLFKLAGPVPLPRKTLLGSWYSRWWDYSQEELLDIVREYREHGFPLDNLVLDMGWHRQDATEGVGWAKNLGWTGWSWNRKLIPEPEKFLQALKQENIAVTLNVHPHGGVRSHEDMYEDFARDIGADPEEKRELPFNAGCPKYMGAYFNRLHAPHEKMGVDFWWVDWQQDGIIPNVKGYPGLKHLPWLNALYYRHTGSNGKRGVSFSRWGGWGDHRHPIHFSGDAKSTWEMLAFEVTFNATAGNTGCFFWSHDLGGFYGERNPELYTRWVQFGLTTATMRIHSDRSPQLDRRPWKWGQPYEKIMRSAFEMRSRLIPYIYSTVWQCHTRGLPLARPLYLHHPGEEAAYAYPREYYFGDAFLAAPVTQPGEGERKNVTQPVWLPEGVWYDFFTGEKFEGPGLFQMESPLECFPFLVKGGVPVPLQPVTQRMTSVMPETIVVRFYPGKPGQNEVFRLFEDDGESKGYLSGEYRVTALHGLTEQTGLSFRAVVEQDRFPLPRAGRTWILEVPGLKRAGKVNAPRLKFSHTYSSEEKVNRITVRIETSRDFDLHLEF